jgi:predicted phosphodiesterase
MTIRVALISDLHGNEVALRSVISDIARVGVDRTVCLGDVATLGPRPGAVLGLVRDHGYPCILGNHDEFLLDSALVEAYTDIPIVVGAIEWTRSQVSVPDLAFVRGFVREIELPLEGGTTLLLFHGSPRSNVEDIRPRRRRTNSIGSSSRAERR